MVTFLLSLILSLKIANDKTSVHSILCEANFVQKNISSSIYFFIAFNNYIASVTVPKIYVLQFLCLDTKNGLFINSGFQCHQLKILVVKILFFLLPGALGIASFHLVYPKTPRLILPDTP